MSFEMIRVIEARTSFVLVIQRWALRTKDSGFTEFGFRIRVQGFMIDLFWCAKDGAYVAHL